LALTVVRTSGLAQGRARRPDGCSPRLPPKSSPNRIAPDSAPATPCGMIGRDTRTRAPRPSRQSLDHTRGPRSVPGSVPSRSTRRCTSGPGRGSLCVRGSFSRTGPSISRDGRARVRASLVGALRRLLAGLDPTGSVTAGSAPEKVGEYRAPSGLPPPLTGPGFSCTCLFLHCGREPARTDRRSSH